jgi:hypothetical protein
MGWFGPRKGPHGDQMWIEPETRDEIREAQEQGKDCVFHGACLGCAWKKGNSTGEGLRWCMGCAFFEFSEHKPNRKLDLR